MKETIVCVDPGICGFVCIVKAKGEKQKAGVKIIDSDCAMIQNLAKQVHTITLKDLFIPVTKNPIFIAAKQANCHLACPVPLAVVKACEVTLDLAVPKTAKIDFID